MRRRDFITTLGGAAATAAWPLAGYAQQAMPVIGYLSGATNEMMHDYVAAFHRGLANAGYIEGQTNQSTTNGRRDTTIDCQLWRPSLFAAGSMLSL